MECFGRWAREWGMKRRNREPCLGVNLGIYINILLGSTHQILYLIVYWLATRSSFFRLRGRGPCGLACRAPWNRSDRSQRSAEGSAMTKYIERRVGSRRLYEPTGDSLTHGRVEGRGGGGEQKRRSSLLPLTHQPSSLPRPRPRDLCGRFHFRRFDRLFFISFAACLPCACVVDFANGCVVRRLPAFLPFLSFLPSAFPLVRVIAAAALARSESVAENQRPHHSFKLFRRTLGTATTSGEALA